VNNSNNRVLVLGLCVALGAGAMMLGLNLFLLPYLEYGKDIDQHAAAVAQKNAKVQQIRRDQVRLQQWRVLSLPGVENLPKVKGPPNPQHDRDSALLQAQDRFGTFLRDLLKKHRLAFDDIPRPRRAPTKGIPEVLPGVPVYTPLQFTVEARGKLDNLVKMLDELQKAPVLHRIRNMTLKQTASTAGKAPTEPLALSMTVEALIVNGSEKRGGALFAVAQKPMALDAALVGLRMRPTGLSIMPWGKIYAAAVTARRKYTDIALKNIFEGAPPKKEVVGLSPDQKAKEERARGVAMLNSVYLTDATLIPTSARATLYNRLNEQSIKLRTSAGWNWIPLLKDGEGGTVVRGEVLRITTRGVVFRVHLVAASPEDEPAARRHQRQDTIYRLWKPDTDELVYNKIIKPNEAHRTYKVPYLHWEALLRDRVLTLRGNRLTFRHDLIRGRVLKSDDYWVVIQLDPRYCGFQGGDGDEPVRPHQGYCFLPMGERLSMGLQTPLKDSEVREFEQAVAQAP
jgi:hypothetical protein